MADAKAEVSRCASPWATVPRRSFAPRPATPAARYGTSVLARYQLCVVWKKPGNVTIGIPLWVEKVQETNGIYGIQAPFFPEHIICRFFFKSPDSQRATDLVQVPPNSWPKGRKAESQQQFFLEGRGFVHHLRASQVKFEPRHCVFLMKIPIGWTPAHGCGIIPYGNCNPENEVPKFQAPNLGVCPKIFRQTHNFGGETVLPWFRLGRWAIWGALAATFASRRRTVPCSPQESWSSIVQILTIDM